MSIWKEYIPTRISIVTIFCHSMMYVLIMFSYNLYVNLWDGCPTEIMNANRIHYALITQCNEAEITDWQTGEDILRRFWRGKSENSSLFFPRRWFRRKERLILYQVRVIELWVV